MYQRIQYRLADCKQRIFHTVSTTGIFVKCICPCGVARNKSDSFVHHLWNSPCYLLVFEKSHAIVVHAADSVSRHDNRRHAQLRKNLTPHPRFCTYRLTIHSDLCYTPYWI